MARLPLGCALALLCALATSSARAQVRDDAAGAVVEMPDTLEDRLAAAEADLLEGEAVVVAQARAAVTESIERRARRDEAGAARAEHIAAAALALVDARRAHHAAAVALEAARARRAEAEARLAAARTASASALRESARLHGTSTP